MIVELWEGQKKTVATKERRGNIKPDGVAERGGDSIKKRKELTCMGNGTKQG